jgi:hypothetical protein
MSKVTSIVPHKSNDFQLNSLATKIFTVGGVDITTNLQPKSSFDRLSPTFSALYSLTELPSSNVLFRDIKADGNIALNYDKSNPKYFAKYGSLLELVRVSLDTVILKYPAALRSKTEVFGKVGNNILNAAYYPFEDATTFIANTSYLSNPFDIYYLNNLNFRYSDDRINPIRNLTQYYYNYEVIVDGTPYTILEFTPASKTSNDFISLKISGNPFDVGNQSKEFYIKPIDSEIQSFYKNLDEFEAYLLNPLTDFAAIFNDTKETDGGVVIEYKIKFQFPKLDAYNLDITSRRYEVYTTDLTDFATRYDETHGNLLMRKLVQENVQSVTLESEDSEFPTYGKINKLLIVYGRELDKINKYIENIKFFNTVTYDKKDNISDALINGFAQNLGWVVDSSNEIDKERWRLLILNSWYIWQSKGTRNAIDFILDFIGIPRDIIDFNEYVIRAKKPIDVAQLEYYYSLFTDNFDMSTLPIDSEGYPIFTTNAANDYFQKNGLSDNGLAYFYKYYNLFPTNFSGTSVNYSGSDVALTTIFEQDFNGTGNTLTYTLVNPNISENQCYDSSGETISDPYPTPILDDCGCPLPISDKSLKICVSPKDLTLPCKPIVLDVYYECTSATSATLHIDTYGGYPPIVLSGATDGQIVSSGDTISVVAIDVSGCTSAVHTITIECIDPCISSDLTATIGYDCILDEFGENTGQAIISLAISGGQEPYTIIGANDGDIVNDGEIATVEVVDFKGCTTGLLGVEIDCALPAVVNCDPIALNATLETTNTEPQNNKAKVNVTYELLGLPSGLFVANVELTSEGVGGDNTYVVGTPVVTNFTSNSGADTLQLDFDPDAMPNSITIQASIVVTLNNGCEYTKTFDNMTVNPKMLGNADFYSTTLTV